MKHLCCMFALLLALLAYVLPDVGARSSQAAERATLAVLYFQNTKEDKEYDWLRKGLTDMLITELVGLDAWRIVERERLQEILKELKLGLSGAIDESTAQKVGKLLGARSLLKGSYIIFGDTVKVDLHLVEVESGEIQKSASFQDTCGNLLSLPAAMARKAAEFTGLAPASLQGKKPSQFGVLDTSRLFYKAMEAYDNYKFAEAEELLLQAVAKEPGNPRVNYFLGECYLKKIKVKTALAYLEKAVALDPANPAYRFTLGKTLMQYYPFDRKRKTEAIGQLEEVVRLAPRHDQAWIQLGFAYMIVDNMLSDDWRAGRITELEYWTRLYASGKRAIECYQKALAIDPDNIMAEQALTAGSSSLLRNLSVAALRLAVLSSKAGDYGKAVEYLEFAAHWDTEYGEIFYELGNAHKAKGDAAAMRAAWKRYLELEPGGAYSEEVRKALGE